MIWFYIILAIYFVPMAAVLITAAAHKADNDEEWYTLMWILAVLPVANIYVMGSIITWYAWKGYHKVFKKNKK